MALLLIEGFDQYGSVAESARGGWSGTVGIQRLTGASTRFNQGVCFECTANNFNLQHSIPASVDVTVGVAVNMADGMIDAEIIYLKNGGITHLVLATTTAGELRLLRGSGGTQLAITSGLGLLATVWFYVEINCRIDNSGDYDVHVDGSQVFSDTAVDTQNGGSAVVDNIQLVGNVTADPRYDDIYVLDDTGSDNVGILGDCRVETVFPDADGNENDFTRVGGGTNNFEAVDDGLTPDDDSTYNHSATATDRELYGFAALAGDVGTVFAVDAKMLVRKEEAGFREVRVIGRSNVTEVESADFTLGVNYGFKNHIFENDPNGGIDWTETSVNAAQFGIDLQT